MTKSNLVKNILGKENRGESFIVYLGKVETAQAGKIAHKVLTWEKNGCSSTLITPAWGKRDRKILATG